ncbi:hypothetical protein Pla110_18260 [Polystyrenella longa]|uniref:Uncharacterized protein n=1 Tax=Polystyrenella longa TaxID=2528007 RepID=A0A518CLQ0_9PLAN|nr:hypothetical protein [Polystyrenella longa]QDU80104.1 hypothetical protein Pla110_18260 [Polystyrenella longa]
MINFQRDIVFLLLFGPLLSAGLYGQELPPNIADSWVATDAIGRKIVGHSDVGNRKVDKQVAMFYWNWHTANFINSEPVNVESILSRHPEAMNDYDHPVWTHSGRHHWSEPLFGYYVSTDEWVLRKHAEMLADAGVDVVFFDCTNATLMWDDALYALGRVWSQARADGVRAPDIAFMCPFSPLDNSRDLITKIYESIYKKGLYRELWFEWDGKPLIMGYPDNVSKEVQEFFTFRPGQPTYNQGPKRPDHWGWLEFYPQNGYLEYEPGKFEQVTVGVAQNATGSLTPAAMNDTNQVFGRSYTQRGGMDIRPQAVNRGQNFQEQWERAFEIDPKLVFVTGWNEWTAGRYKEWQGTSNALPDQCNQEYSRDIEPMKGGHGDNYYYQLVDNVRRFKGVSAPQKPSAPMTAAIDGAFDEWDRVAPVFRDHRDVVAPRDHRGYGSTWYKNDSGRNDIVTCRVGRDSENLYFYVETVADISPSSDNWMMLLLDIDRDKNTGWEGYDFVVNRKAPCDGKAILEKSVDQWEWKEVAGLDFKVKGKQMELRIPKHLFTQLKVAGGFEFKWTDNMQTEGDIMGFYIHGDAAPSGRFNYHYPEY